MSSKFIHLHTHSDFSLKDGAQSVEQITEKASKLRMESVALTDHGSCGGLLKFHKACKNNEVRAIYGLEPYVAPKSRFIKEKIEGFKPSYHLTLLAKNQEGLRNIFRLSSIGWTEGFYYKPRICIEALQEHSEGLVVLSGCGSGLIPYLLMNGRHNEAYEHCELLHTIFKEDFYLEVQNHGLEWQQQLKTELFCLADAYKIPIVATQDSHYLNKEDADIHRNICKLATGGGIEFEGNQSYFKSYEEMKEMFEPSEWHAIDRTVEVANKCQCDWQFGKTIWPAYPLPDGKTPSEELRDKTSEGFKRLFGEGTKEYKDRLEYELGIIDKMDFPTYFLVVADFIQWAENNSIPVGPGRGCLSGNEYVFLSNGDTKLLKNIEVNDKIINRDGIEDTVTNTFEYKINEETLNFKIDYGDHKGITLTKDHIVFGEKHKIVKNFKKWSKSTQKSRRKFEEPTGIIEEIRADNLKVGDWIFLPKIEIQRKKTLNVIELQKYITSNKYKCIEKDNVIVEYIPTNKSFKGSVRDIYRQTNVSRNAITNFRNDTKFYNSIKQKQARNKIKDYILQHFKSVEEWRKESKLLKEEQVTISKYIYVNKEFLWVLGKWIADGWTRSDSERVWGICFNTSECKQIERVEKWLNTLSLDSKKYKHATKELIQIEVHSGIFYQFWKELFKDYEYTSQTKYFPEYITQIEEDKLIHILHGYFNGDSNISSGKIRSCTTSKRLSRQLKFLLLRLGIPSSIRKDIRKDDRDNFPDESISYYIDCPIVEPLTDIFQNCRSKAKYSWRKLRNGVICKIRSISTVNDIKTVYDLSVRNNPSYLTTSGSVHNSGSGSLVAYCIGITKVDPIKYGLYFERFLNPSRVSLPDFDVDFCKERRTEVIDYVIEKYGRDKCAQIGTYSVFKPRGSLRNIARILGYDKSVGEKLSRMVPPDVAGKGLKFDGIIEAEPKLLKTKYKDVVDVARRIEGLNCQKGVHAAGVVISDTKLMEQVPLHHGKNKEVATQFDMHDVEDIGLVKNDFLGLKNLTVIKETTDLIKKHKNIEIDINSIEKADPDPKVFKEIFHNGRLEGVFQFETSSGFRDLCMKVKPNTIEDLSAITSLFRPGPLITGLVSQYVNRRNGEKFDYLFPELEPILNVSYGVLCFQESIMRICTDVAGYTLSEADNMRKIIGKKLPEKMRLEREKFVGGCVKNKIPERKANQLFSDIEGFAKYSFNKCLTKNTKVLSSKNQEVSISKIKEELDNDQQVFLKSFDVQNKEIINDECLEVIDTGEQEVFEIILSNNSKIECTLNHKFLCIDNKMHTVEDIIKYNLDILSCDIL